jgi:hypothetical protein
VNGFCMVALRIIAIHSDMFSAILWARMIHCSSFEMISESF